MKSGNIVTVVIYLTIPKCPILQARKSISSRLVSFSIICFKRESTSRIDDIIKGCLQSSVCP